MPLKMSKATLLIITFIMVIFFSTSNPVSAQNNSICGWIQNNSDTGALAPTLTIWGTNEIVDLTLLDSEPFSKLMDLNIPGYFWIYDPVFQSPGFMTGFSQIEKIPSCEPIQTPTSPPQPTDTSIPENAQLVITGFEIEPVNPSVYELVKLKITIENQGAPLNKPPWGYTGVTTLEDADAMSIESHNFAKGDTSNITPVVEGGQVNFEKWLITIKVRFETAVTNGKVKVVIQPEDQSSLNTEGIITINPSLSSLTCTSVLISKLAGPFASDGGKDILATIAAELQAWGCKDNDLGCQIPPLIKTLVKILVRWFSDIKNIPILKVIEGVWGVFDNDALGVCKDPVGIMLQMVREFNHQGIAISVGGIHSPMLILATNSMGQRVGFVSEEEMVNELPGSHSIEWVGDKFVIFPADNNMTFTFYGTGEGTATITLIDGQLGREISYESFSVIDGSEAQLKLSETQPVLAMDFNRDGAIDENQIPSSIVELQQISSISATSTPIPSVPVQKPTRICGGTIGLIIFPLVAFFSRYRQKHI